MHAQPHANDDRKNFHSNKLNKQKLKLKEEIPSEVETNDKQQKTAEIFVRADEARVNFPINTNEKPVKGNFRSTIPESDTQFSDTHERALITHIQTDLRPKTRTPKENHK